ncbi:MAG: PIN domain-containing protein [Patescibacteria group bacterium]|jgi:hypothetical protein
MSTKKPVKYLFIDSNIYHQLFTKSEKFSDNIIKLLTKLVKHEKIVLLLPQQVIDEVSRNKLDEWPSKEIERSENKKNTYSKKILLLDSEFGGLPFVSSRSVQLIKGQVSREIKKSEKYQTSVRRRFLSSHSKANINFNKILKLATIIEEDLEIRDRAFFRREKGNPPKDSSKFGDKLIWESLLSFFIRKKISNCDLLFVSEDKNAWFDPFDEKMNTWLSNEFNQKIDGQILLISDLSQIPSLTEQEQKDIWVEQFKNVADNKLRYANTFSRADQIMDVIMKNINLVDNQLADKLLMATIENNEYSSGPYNQVLEASKSSYFLQTLLQHFFEKNFDLSPWVIFYNSLGDDLKQKFSIIRKELKKKGMRGLVNPGGEKFLDTEDFPF